MLGLLRRWEATVANRDGPYHWSQLIFMHIPTVNDGDPISGADLAAATGLSTRQIRHAVAYLRDNFPEFPLVSSPKGYRFSLDNIDVQQYRRARVRTAHTTIKRMYAGVVRPYLQQTVPPDIAEMVTRQFSRVLEDVSALIPTK